MQSKGLAGSWYVLDARLKHAGMTKTTASFPHVVSGNLYTGYGSNAKRTVAARQELAPLSQGSLRSI